MRVWAHAVFAAVLLGSLASRERSAEAPIDSDDLKSATLSVARAQGLVFREYRASDTDWGRTMAFGVLGCSLPLLATWRPATFEDEATAQSTLDRAIISSMSISTGNGAIPIGGRSQSRG